MATGADAEVPTSARERLAAIARLVEEACARADGHTLVRIVADDHDVELGLLPLEGHPCDELGSFVAPPEWWAVGLVTHGRARFLDQPDRPPEPIVSSYFLERSGHAVSFLRRGAEVTEPSEPLVGRIPDLCRSMLGLP
jgi:hypothetical protein